MSSSGYAESTITYFDRVFTPRPAPTHLRYGETLYMRSSLSVRRHLGRLWVTASTLGFGSSSLLSVYQDNPGCWPGAQVEWFGDRVRKIKQGKATSQSQSTWTVSVRISPNVVNRVRWTSQSNGVTTKKV